MPSRDHIYSGVNLISILFFHCAQQGSYLFRGPPDQYQKINTNCKKTSIISLYPSKNLKMSSYSLATAWLCHDNTTLQLPCKHSLATAWLCHNDTTLQLPCKHSLATAWLCHDDTTRQYLANIIVNYLN